MRASGFQSLRDAPAYRYVYGIDPTKAPAPFSRPGIVTIPLGFVVLVVVSLMTQPKEGAPGQGFEPVMAAG